MPDVLLVGPRSGRRPPEEAPSTTVRRRAAAGVGVALGATPANTSVTRAARTSS